MQRAVCTGVTLMALVGPAAAETRTPAPDPASPSHRGQFLASLRVGLGLRAIATYEDDTYCGSTSSDGGGFAPVCTGRAPFALDFELGYGLTDRVDLFAELRLGLEPDFDATPSGDDGPNAVRVSPGARFFFSEGGATKLFTTAQVVLDFTGYDQASGESRGTDVGIRNLSGLWVDLDRAYGFYVYLGETATFARWLSFELEGGIGVQGRYR